MTAVSEAALAAEVYALLPDVVLGPDGAVENVALVVDRGRIGALAAPDSLPDRYRTLEITRLERCAIVPGLIDAHHHVIEPFA